MDTREQIAWLARRAGWGLIPGELDELTAQGTESVLDGLLDPDRAGIAPSAPPFDGFVSAGREARQEDFMNVLAMWLDHLESTARPLEDAVSWFWHDHFAVSGQVVRYVPSMIEHLELLRTAGMGSFAELIRSITTDPAMLVFLDGATSTGRAPNENYGRELLELYTLGIGNYTEHDVQAAAAALTGWIVQPRFGFSARFTPTLHDDTARTFLGVDGVHDVDSVVAATMAHRAVPGFIAGKFARRVLGAGVDDAVIERAGAAFSAADLGFGPLARSVLESGLDGASQPIVVEPVLWFVQVSKATGARLENRMRMGLLRMMGQLPGAPSNVGGFPGATTWLASSATAARFTVANVIAARTPNDAVALDAARRRAWDELADVFLRPAGFSDATRASLGDLASGAGGRPGEAHLALALASPDLVVA